MRTFIVFIFAGWFASGCASVKRNALDAKSDLKPTVLLISLDGFRADYLERFATPHLHSLASGGVRAKSLRPVFPSVTFPNHYSIVTGLYPEHHGIVANDMLDPVSGHRFLIKDTAAVESSEWWGGEPLWVTAEKNGQKAGTLFWVGSAALIQNIRPTYWFHYDAALSRAKRLETLFQWLDQPVEKRPTLLTLYFEEPDGSGHRKGPDSKEVREAVEEMDLTIGELLSGLKNRGIVDKVNVVLVSDHGMASVSAQQEIPILDYLGKEKVDVLGGGAFAFLYPKANNQSKVLSLLRKANLHLSVYAKSEIPERFHYRNHRRIPPVFALANEGWVIRTNPKQPKREAVTGAHGYDNGLASMQGVFLASGPAFKKGVVAESFANIEIYNLICKILGLPPAANDGNLEKVKGLLAD